MSNSARLSAAIAAGLLVLGLAGGCGPADAAGVTTPATTSGVSVVATTPAAGSPTPAPVASATTAVAPDTVATTAAAPKPVTTTAAAPANCRSDEYRNSSGHCVPRPTQAPAAPPGASAICNDGSYSFSEHRRGTCSSHGGVRTWLKDLPA